MLMSVEGPLKADDLTILAISEYDLQRSTYNLQSITGK